MKRIYLDYASLTPIDQRIIREMKKYSSQKYANPSSLYKEGVAAKKALEQGRQKVADHINAHADEIVFTSGGTEANALALEGVGRTARHAGITNPHIVVSSIEHSSIMETANMLEKHGVEVTRLSVDKDGLISLDELKKSIKANTILVSILMVNNEIGTIQPMNEIAKIVRRSRIPDSKYPLLHTDAAQALFQDINVEKTAFDLITLDGGKVYGPRGIGALYVRRNTPIEQIIYGGGQEKGLRSGTENVPGIMGFARALELVKSQQIKEAVRLSELKDLFIEGLKQIRPDMAFNGSVKVTRKVVTFTNDSLLASPHIVNVSIPDIDNQFFLFQLDAQGIACSTKSSCLRDEDESYVLKAISGDSKSSLRFSFGRWTKRGDIKKVLKVIGGILHVS